jgi:hypothetical protein
MPIRPELRHLYGVAWRKKRKLALNDRRSTGCEHCGRPHWMMNWAHLSGDPRLPGRMGWLCPSCHAKHDTPQRLAVTRRTRARKHGQLWLAPELEYAHLPMFLWPTRVMRQLEADAQLSLFYLLP